MTVHPLPEPDPPFSDIFGSLLGVFTPITDILSSAIEILGDATVGDLLEEFRDVPLKDIFKELLP